MQQMTLNRRKVLELFSASTALALPGCATVGESTLPVRFEHGVASGDPAADGAVIWTRVSVDAARSADVPVRWIVSARPGGPAVRSSGSSSASAE
ncbi:PhoD-like phosphatase N-terminal domain-containing protein [Porphyrobacter sp. GA68]|uniref:PhoD-like phosphatase N-terminal domain-containing protein n=1 Tax=Porphyrobacter sp. GA68 TaxID=2883480 RepID=UPI001D17DF94|nr:PhoD-like phosphatase N-terminal domain-containing protein [Porphyrobacter sp. GA68]